MHAPRLVSRPLVLFGSLRWLALLPCCLGLHLLAQEAALPPHPTVLTAEYHGKNLPVVAAEKSCPVVLVDGARKVLDSTTPLTTDRAARYLPAVARLSGGVINRYEVEKNNNSGSTAYNANRAQAVDIELSLTADHDLTDCFVLSVTYEETPPDSVNPRDLNYAVIGVHEVGALTAGVTQKLAYSEVVKFPVRYADAKKSAAAPQYTVMRNFWLLFSGGSEVRTYPPAAVSEFFYRRERLIHSLAVASWLRKHQGKDHPVQPMMMIPPLLESTEGLPPNASATLTITADGMVSEVTLDQTFPEEAATVIDTTLKAWLFMPAIKNGKPMPAKVRIPLQF